MSYNPIPDTVFYMRERDESIGGDNPFKWVYKTSKEIFGDKRTVIFSLPGAFTPTCSTFQVPGFEAAYDEMRSLGVDEVYVVSVNDAFVMRKWMIDQKVEKIKALPDGNGLFTEGMGMLVDKSNLGFGKRSWRYAAIIDADMEIERWFIEEGLMDNCPTDPYERSSPENVLQYLRGVNE
jgi:thioredoxin-dependent peroxiredoxin